MNHPQVALGEVADFVNGAAFKPDDWGEDGLPIIRIQNLTDPGKPFNYTERIVAEKLVVYPGDLLVSWSATLGVFQWTGPKGLLNQHIFRVLPNDEVVDKNYLRHALGKAINDMERHLHGATMKHVNRGEFLGTRIPLPPLEEQRRIAAILDKGRALQVLISRREKAFQAIEESLYAALSEQGRTARSSRVFDFADVFWLQEGPGVRRWQFTAEGVKLLNVGNITPDGKVDLEKTNRHISEEEAFGRYSHFLVDEGDLLMPSSGIPIDEDGLLRTRSAFASAEHLPLCMNTSTIRFKPKMDGASLLFLQGWLQSREFRTQITKRVTGSAQKNFGPSHLKQLQITLPEPSAQSEFEEKLNKIRGLRASLSPSVAETDGLIGSISHRLFAGRENE